MCSTGQKSGALFESNNLSPVHLPVCLTAVRLRVGPCIHLPFYVSSNPTVFISCHPRTCLSPSCRFEVPFKVVRVCKPQPYVTSTAVQTSRKCVPTVVVCVWTPFVKLLSLFLFYSNVLRDFSSLMFFFSFVATSHIVLIYCLVFFLNCAVKLTQVQFTVSRSLFLI